jgi:hypothetical protein
MILCDGGGSNASAHYIVKQDLCRLANRMGMKILMVHYPPYCSKYNPIEHKLFAHITRAWQGVPFYNIQFVKELTDRTAHAQKSVDDYCACLTKISDYNGTVFCKNINFAV